MADASTYLAALIAVAGGVHRLLAARGGRADPGLRHLFGFAMCAGAGLALGARPTVALAERIAPPGLADLLADTLMGAGLCFLVLLAVSLQPERRGSWLTERRQIAAAGVVLALRAVLFALAARGADGTGRWALACYDLAVIVYTAWCVAVFLVLLARHARRTAPGPLRAGLRLVVLSAGIGLVWTAWGVDDLLTVLETGRQGLGQDDVSGVLGTVCLAVGACGTVIAQWGAALGAPGRWLRAYRRYRALEPLWSALHTAVPGIALPASAVSAGPGLLGRAEFALYRRVIEIRDGHLALRPYVPSLAAAWTAAALGGPRRRPGPEAPDGGEAPDGEQAAPHGRWSASAGEPEPDRQDATAEAATMAAALEYLRARRRPGVAAHYTPPALGSTLDAEAAWLLRVAAEFTSSAVVAYVRDRAREELRTAE